MHDNQCASLQLLFIRDQVVDMHMTSFLRFFWDDFVAKESHFCDNDLAVEDTWILIKNMMCCVTCNTENMFIECV